MEKIQIVEVSPRDGLQNESVVIDSQDKIELIQQLANAGLTCIETTSFVSENKIPQLADAETVFSGIEKKPGVRYPALVPNVEGLERALSVGVKEIAFFTAASESFTQKNIHCSIEESFARIEALLPLAKANDIRLRGYISCVLGCPYEGDIAAEKVKTIAARLYELGCYEISLGDTIGIGTPNRAKALIECVQSAVPVDALAVHFHDTYGQALANIVAVLDHGIRTIDASVAGLGGCPYAKGASGNVATEDVVYCLQGMGFDTGIDLDKLIAAGQFICDVLGRPTESKLGRVFAKS